MGASIAQSAVRGLETGDYDGAVLVALRRRLGGLWEERPLLLVLGVGAALRVVAAIWARGYGMLDDHFDVVEVAQHWVEGRGDWLGDAASYRSLLYPGLHWALFRALEGMGVAEPQTKMLVVRSLHAGWSLLTVLFGYRLAEALAGKEKARIAGLLLAAFWLAPFMAVRNLVEVACQPPLVAAAWLLVRGTERPRGADAFAAGLLLGLGFTVRFQTAVVPLALFGWLLAERRPRQALLLGLGTAASAAVLQGGSDWLGHGRPFSSVLAYLSYNADPQNIAGYPRGPWHRYLGLLLGVLIPPTSVALLWGGLRGWRRLGVVFWPALAFIALHSAYPGKQERFLLPVLPLVLVACSLGWLADAEESPFWRQRPRLSRGLWAWFWAANAVLLAIYTPNYGKRAQVEALTWLRGRPDLRGVLVEGWGEAAPQPLPLFYLGRPVPVYGPSASVGELAAQIEANGGRRPNYVLLMGDARIEERLRRVAPVAPGLAPVQQFEPGPVDWFLHRMNPRHNVNLTARLYRAGEP
jgi:hypothetical protein